LPTTIPAAKFEISQEETKSAPEAKHSVNIAITVSPAPVTS
jgi:hypothetical protein